VTAASARIVAAVTPVYDGDVESRVIPDVIFSNLAGAGFGIANPTGAGAECFLSCGPT